jgi:hypothetical protein
VGGTIYAASPPFPHFTEPASCHVPLVCPYFGGLATRHKETFVELGVVFRRHECDNSPAA